MFNGLTINNDSSFNITYSSSAGGSTIVSSSTDAQLFGLGAINAQLDVSGSNDFVFENNNSIIHNTNTIIINNTHITDTNNITNATNATNTINTITEAAYHH